MSVDTNDGRLVPVLQAIASATTMGIGGFLLGAVLAGVAGVAFVLLTGTQPPLVVIGLSLVFVQGGFIVITVLYARYRGARNTTIRPSELDSNREDDHGPSQTDDPEWTSSERTGGQRPAEEETGQAGWNAETTTDRETGWDTATEQSHELDQPGARTQPGAASGDSTRRRSAISQDRRQSGEDGGGFHIPASMPNWRDIKIVIGGYVLAWLGAITMGIITQVITQETGAERSQNAATETGLQNPEVLVLLLPAMILLVGPAEELLYRGVVQGRLREAVHPYVAIAIASVIFGVIHWFALTGGNTLGRLLVLPVLMTTGAVLGICYELSDNIVVPSLIHGLYNATIVLFLMVAVFVGAGEPQGSGLLFWPF